MPGRVVAGRYRLDEVLGRGGMGVVWSAHDELIGRAVAVKELRTPPGLSQEERAASSARALREARAAGRLSHPGVVAIHDLVPATAQDDAVYIVMELVEAPSLAELLERYGYLPAERVIRMAVQILGTLDAAHSVGLVHRDVKPGNIMVLPGDEVKLVDFGIAQAMDDTRLTRHGVAGSTGYIAPELFEGADPSPAADLWSLGATLFHAVEGRDPFFRRSTAATLHAILYDALPEPSCPPPLSTLITGLLTRDPADRTTSRQAGLLLGPTGSTGSSAAVRATAPAAPGRDTRRTDPTAGPAPAPPATPSTPTPTGSGGATWQSHPTGVNPVVTRPYAVPRDARVKTFHRWARFASLVLHGGAAWFFLFQAQAALPLALPPLAASLLATQGALSVGSWDRIDMTAGGISYSRSREPAWRPRPKKYRTTPWNRIGEVVVAGITRPGPANAEEARTRIFVRVWNSLSSDDSSRKLHTRGALADTVAPADVIEAALRAAAPPGVRITREADVDARTPPVPGPRRGSAVGCLLVVACLIGAAVAVVTSTL
ncbi:serine/threonine-protein kinase [Streptomyces sp. NPDC003247]|uniref:serine/threonine-protein kinase n=1 Tax=Streptomyces sp. NPDC003247 TaxID=3364677 RepID=UPI003676967C